MGRSQGVPSARRRSQRLKNKEFIKDANSDDEKAEIETEATVQDDSAASADDQPSIPTLPVVTDDPPSVDVVDSDDEEGPDDVSLSTGRLVSMETRRLEQDHTKRAEETVREKRRKKHELFSSQKMSKTITKTITRFSEEALEDISLKLAEQTASKKAKKRLNKKVNHRQRLLKSLLPTEAVHDSIRVVALSEHSGPGGALKEDFRKQHFYGDRLKRLPILTIQAKKYRNLPAKNFVKAAL